MHVSRRVSSTGAFCYGDIEGLFANLTQRLGKIFDGLRHRGALSEEDVKSTLREIRIALLEADVALPVAKDFVTKVQERAVGEKLVESVSPGQLVVKIVHDTLVEVLGADHAPLYTTGSPPLCYLMAGLQGSGKTTFTAKLAKYLANKERKKVLIASSDIYRPAAKEQLATLAQKHELNALPIVAGEAPLATAQRGLKTAKTEGYDIFILDTAGRLHIDAELMQELQEIRAFLNPHEILLVADAMTGQDAVNVARSFHEALHVTGIILTRVDGDARGGAALSMKAITGQPIKFLSTGEHVDQLEVFQAERLASRILDMGDVVSLVEKAMETVDAQTQAKMAESLRRGQFDMNAMAQQLEQIGKMGGLSSIMKMLPGMGRMQDQLSQMPMDDRMIKQQLAIIRGMTFAERSNPDVLNASRKRRIAAGSGVDVAAINRLLKQFRQMSDMTKRMSRLGDKKLLRGGLRGLFRS